jgi:hypothetical protein
MKSYVFCDRPALYDRFASPESIREVLRRVADGTDVGDLVVSLYLVGRGAGWGGHALARGWSAPSDFFSPAWPRRRRPDFARPIDLPARYMQIRLFFGGGIPSYPNVQISRYGFRWRFRSFADHLAHLFAHELHHYRRDHLGLHPREGEIAAEQWAYARLRALGFGVDCLGRCVRGGRRRRALPAAVLRAHERLGGVRAGESLVYVRPACRWLRPGETVLVVRPPRRGAYRMSVVTARGVRLLVPLVGLRRPTDAKTG